MSMEHPEKQKNAVKSVVDQVMDGIISQIIDGTLHPGDKLPTEMELCKQFGAGRNSVREAVKKLQAYGILYIKRADGTFVSENYNQKMLDPMAPSSAKAITRRCLTPCCTASSCRRTAGRNLWNCAPSSISVR